MKKSDKLFVVYCHQNKLNGKRYIGITCQDLNKRFRNGKGYKSSPYFYSAIQKYGWENFTHEVLYGDLTIDEAKKNEIELIELYQTRNQKYGYNITPSGEGYVGEDNPWYDKHHSEKAKKMMSEARKGIPKTEEWKRKIGESNKGKTVSEETKLKMRENHADVSGENNPCYGKKLSEEQIRKMVMASKAPNAIKKMKQNKIWYSGKDNPNSKRVICLDNGMIFNTLKEAAEYTGCQVSKISAVCHGHREHTKHLHFELLED